MLNVSKTDRRMMVTFGESWPPEITQQILKAIFNAGGEKNHEKILRKESSLQGLRPSPV